MTRSTVVTIVVILGLFIAGATALIWPQFNQAPQTNLTQSVQATVTDKALIPNTGMPSRDYMVTYTYEVAGATFRAQVRSIDGQVSGSTLTVCVDPARPEVHAALVNRGATCGDVKVGKWTQTAERVSN
jgi:hypothetical protein